MFEKIKYAVGTAKRAVTKAKRDYEIKMKHIQNNGVSEVSDITNQILDNLYENYKLPSVEFKEAGYGVAKPDDSFAYGYPRFIDGDIPVDSKGAQLRFMAQINCRDLSNLPGYPHTGLLQFWVQGEKHIMFSKDPKAYQVIYIANPSTNNIDNVQLDEALYNSEDAGDFPSISGNGFNPEYNVIFTSVDEVTNPHTGDYYYILKLAREEYTKITGSEIPKDIYDEIKDRIFEDKRLEGIWGNRVGGYPGFTQNGPLDRDDEVLLLQLDTSDVNGIEIMWGDCGIAGFFIYPKDLKNNDFSKIDFYWDCC